MKVEVAKKKVQKRKKKMKSNRKVNICFCFIPEEFDNRKSLSLDQEKKHRKPNYKKQPRTNQTQQQHAMSHPTTNLTTRLLLYFNNQIRSYGTPINTITDR